MSNRYARLLAAACAAALAAAIGATPALAATTWTIQPGGAITATSGIVRIKDTKTDTLSCRSATVSGTLKHGSGLSGSPAGFLSAVGFTGCTLPGDGRVIVTLRATDLPWHVNLSSYDAATGVVRGTIGHIQIMMSSVGCTAVIDGTGGTASDGRVRFTYTDGTGQLRVLTAGGNLHYYDVTGCLGAVNNGDPVTLSATFTVTPEQAITSP